jgi:hypothetical protein
MFAAHSITSISRGEQRLRDIEAERFLHRAVVLDPGNVARPRNRMREIEYDLER